MAADLPELEPEDRRRLGMAARALDSELPPANPMTGPPTLTLEELRRLYVEHVLKWTDTRAEAASVLGVNPCTLYRRSRKPTPGG